MLPGILMRFKKEIDSVLKGQTNFIIIPEIQKVPELEQELIYREELFFLAGHEMVNQTDAYLDKTQRRFITIAQGLWA